MSTNYYFQWKNYNLQRTLKEIKTYLDLCRLESEEKFDLLERFKYELEDLNKIHIGKTGYGKKPSFQKTKYFSSVKEIEKFYENNRENLEILNEYGDKFTIKELRYNLFEYWGENRFPGMFKYMKDYLDEDGHYFVEGDFTWFILHLIYISDIKM